MSRWIPAAKTAAQTGWSLKRTLYMFAVFIFFGFIILQAAMSSLKAGSVEPGLEVAKKQLLEPSINIKEQSKEIIDTGTFIDTSDGTFSGFIDMIMRFWGLFSSVFYIGLWIIFLTIILPWTPLSALSSTKFTNLVAAVTILWVMQVFVLLWQTDVSVITAMWEPIQTWWYFGQALYILMT